MRDSQSGRELVYELNQKQTARNVAGEVSERESSQFASLLIR